jgi:Mn2+/Fe2+ NRAMP family transporter
MVFIVLLANNQRLLGDYKNSKSFNIIAWGSVGLIALMSTVWLTMQVIGMLK